MRPVTKLLVFALGLALVFVAALGAGAAVSDGNDSQLPEHGRHPATEPSR